MVRLRLVASGELLHSLNALVRSGPHPRRRHVTDSSCAGLGLPGPQPLSDLAAAMGDGHSRPVRRGRRTLPGLLGLLAPSAHPGLPSLACAKSGGIQPMGVNSFAARANHSGLSAPIGCSTVVVNPCGSEENSI